MFSFVYFISLSVRDGPGVCILFPLKIPQLYFHYNLPNNDIIVATVSTVLKVSLIIPLTEGPGIVPSI